MWLDDSEMPSCHPHLHMPSELVWLDEIENACQMHMRFGYMRSRLEMRLRCPAMAPLHRA
jgi:hypothetical protein